MFWEYMTRPLDQTAPLRSSGFSNQNQTSWLSFTLRDEDARTSPITVSSADHQASHRRYELLSSRSQKDYDERHAAPAVVVEVSLTPPGELEAEFNVWYTEEHIPKLSRVPGWMRSRRFRLLEGSAPTYLAFHEYAPQNGMGTSPEFRAAVSTPACKRLIAACRGNGPLGYERNEWRPVIPNDTSETALPAITTVVATPDGGSTIVQKRVDVATSTWIGSMSVLHSAKCLQFKKVEPRHSQHLSNWHTVESKRIEINVDQTTRLSTSDGAERLLRPGDIVSYEDTYGKGHRLEGPNGIVRTLIVIS